MKQYRSPLNQQGFPLVPMVMTLLLFFCRDSMFSTAILSFYGSQFLNLGLIALLGIGFLAANFRRWKEIFTDPRLLLMAAAAGICLLPMVAKRDWQLMYCSVLLCVLLGIFLTFIADRKQLAKWYVCTLAVLGAYSVLAAYLLRLGVDAQVFRVPTFTNGAGFEFHNFFLSVVPDSYVRDRNFGIFREPGVYQFFLLLALYLNNDWLSWDKGWKQWTLNGILGVTMLSTFATGGVIEMGLLAVLLFFDKKWYRDKTLRFAALALIAGGVALVAYCIAVKNDLYWAVYDMFIGKFQDGNETGSDRILSITVNLKTFLGSPLVGERLSTVLHSVENNTSSTMILLAAFGILGGGLHLASWLALVWNKERHILVNLCYLGILAMSFNTQNLIADVFLWALPMMALTEWLWPLMGKKAKGETNGR